MHIGYIDVKQEFCLPVLRTTAVIFAIVMLVAL